MRTNQKPKSIAPRIKQPALLDVGLQPNGELYVNRLAYEKHWKMPRSNGVFYDGFFTFYTPMLREITIIPTDYDREERTNNAICLQGRGYTARLWKLMKQHGIRLKQPVHAKFERRGKMLVFEIPKDSIA